MKKDKAQRPNLTWVRDEAAPINEEDRQHKLEQFKHLADMLSESDEFAKKIQPILNYKFPKLDENGKD